MLGLLSLLVAAPPLFVDVRDHGPCEHSARIPAALSRITDLSVVAGPSPPAALSLKVTSADGGLLLELDDPSGPGIHGRRIADPPEACAATADGVALIVERYLRSLGILPPEPPPPPAPPPPPPPTARTATIASPPGPPIRLTARAQGLLEAPAPGSVRWGGSAELSFGFGPLFIAASAAGTLPIETEVLRQGRSLGTLRVWSLFTRLSLGVCLRLGGWLCPALDVGAERTVGAASGRLPNQTERPVLRPIFGASARYDWGIVGPLGLTASLAGVIRPSAPIFTVDGASPDAEELVFTLLFALGISVEIL